MEGIRVAGKRLERVFDGDYAVQWSWVRRLRDGIRVTPDGRLVFEAPKNEPRS
jgi:hypothetical protein